MIVNNIIILFTYNLGIYHLLLSCSTYKARRHPLGRSQNLRVIPDTQPRHIKKNNALILMVRDIQNAFSKNTTGFMVATA